MGVSDLEIGFGRQLVELVVNTSIANLNNRVTDSFEADVELDE